MDDFSISTPRHAAAAMRGLAAAAGALMLAGCAVGPNFSSPPAPTVAGYTPEKLQSPPSDPAGPRVSGQRFVNGADIPTRWWAAFRSAPLNQLIRLSVERNPSLQAAEAAIRLANFNALAQRGLYFPQVGANFTPSDQLVSNAVSGPGNTAQARYTLYTAQLNISFVPDVWGENMRNVESLDALTEQAQFQLEAAYLTLTSNVVTAAIQEASLRGQIAATEHIIKVERDILGILQNQFNAGQAAQVDVLAQQAALAQSEETLPPLQKQLAIQRDLLTALAGQFSADEILQKFDLQRLALPANLPVSLPSTLVAQRPDVRAAEANLHSASALVGAAIAARLPSFTISANPGSTAFNAAQLFTPGTLFYTVAGSATQTVFDGLTLYHKQKAAEAALEQGQRAVPPGRHHGVPERRRRAAQPAGRRPCRAGRDQGGGRRQGQPRHRAEAARARPSQSGQCAERAAGLFECRDHPRAGGGDAAVRHRGAVHGARRRLADRLRDQRLALLRVRKPRRVEELMVPGGALFSLSPFLRGEGWGEGPLPRVRNAVRPVPLTRIASADAIRPLPQAGRG
ncbi:efflux transporter outer membrane subunit [Bradyrhizobium septentrionale]|uniref:efflux transporter outer membrane subunit n=1 Tax=Bradyrhizobium septentrionale TaxID=1404411 RepID=UPI003BB1B8AF